MITESQEVRIRDNGVSKVVGTATYPKYETVSEALSDIGEPKVLENLNAQVRTNEMNRVRALARNGPSSKTMQTEALKRISADEFAACAGDFEAIQKLIEAKIEIIRAEHKAALMGAGGQDDDDEDNN